MLLLMIGTMELKSQREATIVEIRCRRNIFVITAMTMLRIVPIMLAIIENSCFRLLIMIPERRTTTQMEN